jgi:DNA-binding MarR family transcriptional regulator
MKKKRFMYCRYNNYHYFCIIIAYDENSTKRTIMNKSISILGIQTELVPIQRASLKGLNADVILRFSFFSAVFNGQALCTIQTKNKEISIPPMKYKRITEQVESVVGMPVAVLLDDSLIYVQRERLINQGVYFIVSDKYAFLPSVIVNSQLKKKKKLDRLTPVAQYILLYYLSDVNSKSSFTIKELEDIISYSYVTIARAIVSLEDCGLCQVELDETNTKQIHFADSKRELWESAQKYLTSPVKKVLCSDMKPEKDFSISGVNALSHYSHLNPEENETVAIWEKLFKFTDKQYNEIESPYKIEVWKYPTSMPNQNKQFVDKLSLYLSMKDEPDPRMKKELEIMIEGMKW